MPTEKEIKQCVVDIARKQVGSHYLLGAAGATPGNSDGASYRPSYVQVLENVPNLTNGAANGNSIIVVAAFFAAWAYTSEGQFACAGRCAVEDVQKLPLALDLEVKKALVLRLKDLTPAQRDALKKNVADPGKFRWPRPNGPLSKSDPPCTVWAKVVWAFGTSTVSGL